MKAEKQAALLPVLALLGGFALAWAGVGVLAAGALQTAPTPETTIPEPSSTPVVPPEPALTASPSPSPGSEAIYAAPVVGIEPLPAPAGSAGYLGLTAAGYCALKTPAYSASGSDPTAFLVAANNERARTGAPPLRWAAGPAAFAQSWSDRMAADHNAHPEWRLDTAEGQAAWTASVPNSPAGWAPTVFRHSPSPHAYAENVGWNNYPDAGAVDIAQVGWMGSALHCLNIMNPAYTHFGAAKTQAADGSWFFAEEFIW